MRSIRISVVGVSTVLVVSQPGLIMMPVRGQVVVRRVRSGGLVRVADRNATYIGIRNLLSSQNAFAATEWGTAR